jgi:hypothetical protein
MQGFEKEESDIQFWIMNMNTGQSTEPLRKYLIKVSVLKTLLLSSYPTILRQIESVFLNL